MSSERLNEAVKQIEMFNAKAEQSYKVNVDIFVDRLKKMGGVDDEALSAAKFEDLEECGLPKFLSRQIAAIFRTREKAESPQYVKESQAKMLPLRRLIELYDIKESDNTIGKVLSDKSKGQRFLVLNTDGSKNVDESLKQLEAIRDGHEPLKFVMVNGLPLKAYSVGERPDSSGDINPLFPNEALRPGGICGETQRFWEGVGPEIRKIIYLAVKETQEINVSDSDLRDVHGILDLVTGPDALAKIQVRFPKAVIKLSEMRNRGEEPSLRTQIRRNGSGKNDPFYGKHVRT